MAYSEKSWEAAFRAAEKNLKRSGKEVKKAAKKAWDNDFMVGAMSYCFRQGVAEAVAEIQAQQKMAGEEAEAKPSEEVDMT